jgi:hypothetical protein
MPTESRRKDPQDQEFGETARLDQEWVDALEDEGVSPEDAEQLDPGVEAPRAAGKAEPPPVDR